MKHGADAAPPAALRQNAAQHKDAARSGTMRAQRSQVRRRPAPAGGRVAGGWRGLRALIRAAALLLLPALPLAAGAGSAPDREPSAGQAAPAAPVKAEPPAAAGTVDAAAPFPAPAPASARAGRPRIGLVLSGGGARGFAHIGVLRILQALRVPVDVVAGTSMGAIVGGLYATGYTPAQLEKMVRSTDWQSIFNPHPPRADLDWRRKEDDYKNLSNFELGIVDGGLTLPRGLAGTQRLEFFLRSLSDPSKRVRDLSRLPLPFAAIATDLETGKRVLLQQDVPLSTALRASMSVPGVFTPVEVNDQLLVDGGVVDNLPVSAARAMGADIVIAVNVGTPLLTRRQLNDVVGVAAQLTLIIGRETIERSIASLQPDDLLITPDLAGLSSTDFSEGERLMEAGAVAAFALASRLLPLAVTPDEYARYENRRTELVRNEQPVTIDELRVAEMREVQPAAIAAQAQELVGRTLTTDQIGATLDRIYSSGDFEAVSYALVDDGDRSVLVVTPYEKSWGYNVLRVGGNVQTDFKDDNSFNLLLAHSWRWFNRWGGEWRNEVQIGQNRRFMTEFYQPLGAGSRWFLQPRLEALRQEGDLFVGDTPVTRFENTQRSASLSVGRELEGLGVLRVGLARSRLESRPVLGLPFSAEASTASSLLLQWRSDTLDEVLVPRRGHFIDLRYRRYDKQVGALSAVEATSAEVLVPFSVERYTLNLALRAGTSVQEGRFQLGGLFNLTGTRSGQIAGDRGMLLRAVLYRNISDLVELRMPVYVGASMEAGNAVARGESLRLADFRRANAIFIGMDSFLGPIYLAAGRTIGGDSGFYLMWGRPQ